MFGGIYFFIRKQKYIFSVNYVGPVDMPPYSLAVYKNAEGSEEDNYIGKEKAHIIK